jgi:hypothetical protein
VLGVMVVGTSGSLAPDGRAVTRRQSRSDERTRAGDFDKGGPPGVLLTILGCWTAPGHGEKTGIAPT